MLSGEVVGLREEVSEVKSSCVCSCFVDKASAFFEGNVGCEDDADIGNSEDQSYGKMKESNIGSAEQKVQGCDATEDIFSSTKEVRDTFYFITVVEKSSVCHIMNMSNCYG